MIEKDGLIVCLDDDVGVLKRLDRLLRFEGFSDVVLCEHAREIWPILKERRAVALVLDLLMPDADGYEVLEAMRREHPEVPVIVATALDDLDAVVRSMKAGAFDYVPKSAESTRLIASIEHAALIGSLQEYNKSLRDTLLAGDRALPGYFNAIVTRDSRMLAIFRYIEAIAGSDKAILLTGESGTGKELFAAAIHAASGRRGPLVSLNIAGLDDTMFSDTLFGHKRGAFTGADGDRPGLIERASGGTLFLDEIGDLAPQSQVKLLRLIEQRLYYPLGADLTRSSDALIVAATNKDVEAMAAAGSFRQDLFYRLGTHRIHIPPLRERLDDLPLLVERFVEQAAGKFAKKRPSVPPELYELLGAHDFPGNVRELESMIHDAVGRSDSRVLALASFRDKIFKQGAPARQAQKRSLNAYAGLPVLPSLKEASEELIREALRRAGGNQGVAAALLGISRSALNRRINNGEDCDD
jgi:DNA-binding NtrC family response regulator